MKRIKKFGAIFFISSYLVIGGCLIIPQSSLAAETVFTPQISIPGSEFQKGVGVGIASTANIINTETGKTEQVTQSNLLARYIAAFYKWGLSIVGALAVLMLMAAGVIWITSMGDAGKIGNAKKMIEGCLLGSTLLIGSYFFLNIINPNLTKLSSIKTTLIVPLSFEDGFVNNTNDLPKDTVIKFKCLPTNQTCEDTVPPSMQLNLSICYEKFGRDFSCTDPTLPTKNCCALSDTITKSTNEQCAGKDDGAWCKATPTSGETSGYCKDGKCDGEKVCCQCNQGCLPVVGCVYNSCRNDITAAECNSWCINAWVGAAGTYYSGGSSNYSCKGGAFSSCTAYLKINP